MRLGIKNRKAIVTGAGRGIGEAIAFSLSREGVRVAVISRTENDLKLLVKKMGGKKTGHMYVVADLTSEDGVRKAIKKIQSELGDPDIVVNNLGSRLEITDPFCSITDWRKLWRINFEVAVELNNLVIPFMRKNHWGRIVNISSISALENQGTMPYCTLKAALTAYSRSMGRILSSEGIIMTSVLPGAVHTVGGYWDKSLKERPDYVKQYVDERMAIKRLGRPEEIADMVTFLCSERASFCVGSAVVVDGGQGRCLFQ